MKKHVKLKDMIREVLARYGGRLDNAALSGIIYLIDIEYVRRHDSQATDIFWQQNSDGPFTWDIMDCVNANPHFFGVRKDDNRELITATDKECPELSEEIGNLIDYVKNTAPDPKTDFTGFVNMTSSAQKEKPAAQSAS